MRTLVHLSDLHFGRVDEALLAPLRDCVTSLAPHLVVVSGDLTQRARSAQFEAARTFLDTLPKPQLIVPGNHDVPLYNVFARFLTPLKKYARHITPDLNPVFQDEEMTVVGLNSARSLVIKDGRVNEAQVDLVRTCFRDLPADQFKIVVTHHPFEIPDELPTGKQLNPDEVIDRAEQAMRAFSAVGTDVLLSGHLHASHVTDTQARYPHPEFSAVIVQAGTATSSRGRGEENSFNVLTLDKDNIGVRRYAWSASENRFGAREEQSFRRENDHWVQIDPGRGEPET